MTPDDLAKQLRNIGPKTAEILLAAGITSREQLIDLGAEEAFIMAMETGRVGFGVNAAFLYALEGAILNCDWRDIGEARKREFKIFAKGLREEMK